MGDYEGALGRLLAAGLDQLTEKSLPTRSLRIVAESYAIKGEIVFHHLFTFHNYLFIDNDIATSSLLLIISNLNVHFICYGYI